MKPDQHLDRAPLPTLVRQTAQAAYRHGSLAYLAGMPCRPHAEDVEAGPFGREWRQGWYAARRVETRLKRGRA